VREREVGRERKIEKKRQRKKLLGGCDILRRRV